MAAERTPAAASLSRKDTLEWLPAIDDPKGEYSAPLAPHYDGQNAREPESAHVRKTGISIEQSVQILEQIPKEDRGSYFIINDNNIEDDLKDCIMNENNDSDEDDEVDGKSSDQNNLFSGTKATDKAESATLLQQNVDFSPTATAPIGISVPKVTTISFGSLQKPEKVEEKGGSVDVYHTSLSVELDPHIYQIAHNPSMDTELVMQTGDGVNLQMTVHDKEDEVNGGIILDQMKDGTNRPSFSTFGAVNDKQAPATGATSPTTANDVRLAVPSLEPFAKRAKVNEDEILVNVRRASSSSSAARP